MYTTRPEYGGMKDTDGGYFEFQKASDRKRRSKDSPGQILSCFQILGTL